MRVPVAGLACWVLFVVASPVAGDSPPPPDDRFIAGYAAAVLERELQISAASLAVRDGVVHLDGRGLGTIERNKIDQAMRAIPGVRDVQIRMEPVAAVTPVDPSAPATTAPTPADSQTVPQPTTGVPVDRRPRAVLAPGRLFEPLLADPRWPHFYASYHYYSKDGSDADVRHVGSVGFGETIAFIRQQVNADTRIEAGVQAGVFAIFDLASDSKDLINADYFVGPFVSVRSGDLSLMSRVYHQSSHLGDEYLLRDDVDQDDRLNLSYEVVDLLASYEFGGAFRAYGGAGYIFHRYPDDLDPWLFQYGAEFRSQQTFANGLLRPVAAADLQHRQQSDYDLDLSLRVGVQIEDPKRFSQRLTLLLEYYNGRSPNGQFYDEGIEYFGLGMHFHF